MTANIFTIPPGDKSIYYLGKIFGNVGSVLTGAQDNPFISNLFLTMNTIALTVGAIIVVYVTVVGMMKTAAEGEFLGKQWSSLWVPIRMVVGVASLFPAVSGYSMIQVVIMWIIVQGVGAADSLWTAALGLKSNQAAVAAAANATPNTANIGVTTAMRGLFQGLVCEETAKMSVPAATNDISFANFKGTNTFSANSATFNMGPNGACGKLTKCNQSVACQDSSSAQCQLCTTQNTTLNQVISVLQAVAQKFVNADQEYLTFYYTSNDNGYKPTGWIKKYCDANGLKDDTCCRPPLSLPPPGGLPPNCRPNPPDQSDPRREFPSPVSKDLKNNMSTGPNEQLEWIERWALFPALTGQTAPVDLNNISDPSKVDFITINANFYTNALKNVAQQNVPSPSPGVNFDRGTAKDQGWLTAGAYFYRLVQLAKQSMAESSMPLSVNGLPAAATDRDARYNFVAAREFITAISESSSAEGATQQPGGGGGGGSSGTRASYNIPGSGNAEIGSALSDTSAALYDSFRYLLTNSSKSEISTLLSIATFGQNLLITAQVFYVVIMVVSMVIAGLAALGEIMVAGSGHASSLIEIFKALSNMLLPAVYILLGALMVMGALLGMYVPMIPFVVFTASVVGWFIAVIEAMIAAPIVALGLITPGGQSEVFGRAEHALMIIFNLFLRPTLMVFGLLIASILAEVVVSFICMGFNFIMWDVMHLGPGLVEQIIFIAIFCSLIITSVNQAFTLIHHIPERVLTYIGGQAYSYGEQQASQAVKGAVEGAAGQLAGAGRGMGEGAGKTMEEQLKKAEDKEKEKKKGVSLGGGDTTA